jgi:Spy/CpxP family protein refolding chaperone
MSRAGRFFGASILVMTLLMAGSLSAQPAPKTPAGPPAARPGAPTVKASFAELLNVEPIQKEIKLTDEQKQKIKDAGEKVQKAMRAEYAGLRDVPPDDPKLAEAGEKLNQIRIQHLKELDTILTPQQIEQLQQMSAQIHAWMGGNNPQVAKELTLSDPQKKQLAEIREDAEGQMWLTIRAASKKTLDVLTPEQRVKLEELLDPARAAASPLLRAPRKPGSTLPSVAPTP